MKQQVDVTLKLSLWLDAALDEDEIVTHVRSSLPKAFGAELTAMKNPVDILEVRQEAAIYGDRATQPNDLHAPWSLHFDRNGTEDVAIIRDDEGADLVHSRHFGLADRDDPLPATLAALRVMVAAPRLLGSLTTCANLLADYDESDGPEGEAYRDAVVAIDEATGRAA